MVSTGRSGNQSNTGVVECPPEVPRPIEECAGHGTLVRMRMLADVAPASGDRTGWTRALAARLRSSPSWRSSISIRDGLFWASASAARFYALFLCFPIAAFLTHESPRSRDDRLVMTCVALGATFLLVGLQTARAQRPGALAPSHSVTGLPSR